MLAAIGIAFYLPSAAFQIGLFPKTDSYLWLAIGFASVSGILWCAGLCFLSVARGYHPLWGLVLLFPPAILVYTSLFPDKNADRL